MESKPQLDTPRDPRHLRESIKESFDDKLNAEYNAIPSYMPTLQELPPGTKQKNRYVNVLPNEATRVPLSLCDGDPTSFFINANFVSGYKTKDGADQRRYIAAQGPLPTTMDDFWRMIWEQKIECIVMTTGLIEGNRRKCHRYWPDEETEPDGVEYGNCKLEITDTQDCGEWVHTTMSLTNSEAKETRKVQHFWYTGWPDHGVPATAAPVIGFLQHIRKATTGSTSPILVHCSAGIGRTGTFMTIDIGMQELQSEWRVTDIKGNVTKMRQERGGSVQTAVQYKFIHQALEEYSRVNLPHSMFGANQPRDVVLQTSEKFPYLGFTARGSHPTFVTVVDAGGLAESVGLKPGDHLLKVNGLNAMSMSHKQTVEQIKKAGSKLALTVVSKVPY